MPGHPLDPAARGPCEARRLAQGILVRVARDGAFAERLLSYAPTLPGRDRALLTELVYGTLRHLGYLDHRLEALTSQPLRKLPPPVLAALRLGAYQLLCLRLPPHSAVHESVALVTQFGRLRGVVNAVLRRLAQEGPQQAPQAEDVASLATRTSLPAWLVEEVVAQRGAAAATAWAHATMRAPPVCLRVNLRRVSLAEFTGRLDDAGVVWQRPLLAGDRCVLLPRPGPISALPGYDDGWFVVQDAAAAWATALVDFGAAACILDVCAAPGGKATHLAECYPQARVVAVDRHPRKLRLVVQSAARLGLPNLESATADGREPEALRALLPTAPDGIVLDAPCSGMGTLRRHVELRRRAVDSLPALIALQAALLRSVAPLLRPGGLLLYCVCSPLRAEGPEQVEAFLAAHRAFEVLPLTPQGGCADGPYARAWTDLHGSDSFFVAGLRKAP